MDYGCDERHSVIERLQLNQVYQQIYKTNLLLLIDSC